MEKSTKKKRFLAARLLLAVLACAAALGAGSLRAEAAQKGSAIEALDLTRENLSNGDNYISGWYKSWGGKYASSSGCICSADYFRVSEGTYDIHISDARLEINIAEYDANGKWLKHTDKIYDGSTFTKQEKTAYIHITIFSTKWGVKLLPLFSNGLEIEFINENEEAPDGLALTTENLSSADNYMYGWYKSWGGQYTESSSSICSADYYRISVGTYYFYINDSRIYLEISEYDANKNWLKFTGKVSDGTAFTPQEDTAYIKVTCMSSVWGVKPLELLEYGLKLRVSTVELENPGIGTVDISDADFTNTDNWMAGAYAYQTGAFAIDTAKICYTSYLTVGSDPYVVNLPGGYLKMTILELDEDGNTVNSTALSSGQKWQKQETTAKIALTVACTSSAGYTLDEYKQLILGYSNFGLNPYQRSYTADGSMADLTASEFVKNMNVGWNLGNSFDARSSAASRGEDANLKQEMNWGNPYVTKDLIDYVAECGFNTIRIPVTWYYNTYTDEDGNLRVGQQWLERVREVVDYAMADGLYVIINSHHDQPILYAGTTDEDMEQVLRDAESLWTDIAEYFKDYDEHLIFESYNEIDNIEKSWNYSDTAVAQMNQMNQVFVDAVRATGGNNAQRILMVPTLLDSPNSKYMNAFVVPEDSASDRIVLQVHYYSNIFNEDLEGMFTQMETYSEQLCVPIVIGEFGTTKSYKLSNLRAVQASNYVARAAEHGIKCIWWDNGSDYGIIDRRDFSNSKTDILNALLEGASGAAYTVSDELVFDDISKFVRKMPNLTTGLVEEKYWGTLTTEIDGGAIPVQGGSKVIISLSNLGDASDLWLQRVLFYDADGNYLSGKELQTWSYICTIPENAAYMRVSLNSAYRTISLKQYSQYLADGDLRLGISFPGDSNIEKVMLPVK